MSLRSARRKATHSSVVHDETLPPEVLAVGGGFWNLRGSFKVGGLVEIGTQASLVRRANGRYLLLDACALSEGAERWVRAETEDGAAIEAVLHLHPFHTIHVRSMHARFPHARLHGTARHRRKAPELPWDSLRTEEPELHARYAEDLQLTVPRGVELIPDNEHLHFSSVLALHPASRTLHVDDTLGVLRPPAVLRAVVPDGVHFHPTLARVLERRPGAAADFRAWAGELVSLCRDVDNLCAAHTAPLLGRDNRGPSIAERVERALAKVEPTLRRHERRWSGEARHD
jgi:hypothetical protein